MTSLETVTAYYNAFNTRNWNDMLALVDENITHEPNQGTSSNREEIVYRVHAAHG